MASGEDVTQVFNSTIQLRKADAGQRQLCVNVELLKKKKRKVAVSSFSLTRTIEMES